MCVISFESPPCFEIAFCCFLRFPYEKIFFNCFEFRFKSLSVPKRTETFFSPHSKQIDGVSVLKDILHRRHRIFVVFISKYQRKKENVCIICVSFFVIRQKNGSFFPTLYQAQVFCHVFCGCLNGLIKMCFLCNTSCFAIFFSFVVRWNTMIQLGFFSF